MKIVKIVNPLALWPRGFLVILNVWLYLELRRTTLVRCTHSYIRLPTVGKLITLSHFPANRRGSLGKCAWDFLTHAWVLVPCHIYSDIKKEWIALLSILFYWRRTWDSNPRGCYTLLAFQASSLATRSILHMANCCFLFSSATVNRLPHLTM